MNELIEYILENKSKTLDLLDWSFRNNFIEMFNLDTILLIAKLRPDIEKISIAYIYPEMLRNLQHLPNLKELYLEECVVIQEDWQEIIYLKKLESLSIWRIEYIDKELFFYLATLPNFLSLSIDQCEYLQTDTLKNIATLKTIKNLTLGKNDWIGDQKEIFKNIALSKSLDSLEISYGLEVKDEDILSLLPLKNSLAKLIINFNKLSDLGFSYVCQFIHLEHLQIEWCSSFSDKSLSFLCNLTKLKTLQLKHSLNISEVTLSIIGHLKNLTHLTLFSVNCHGYPLQKLSKLEALEHLSIRGTFQNIEGIESLTNLKSLRFSKISDFEGLKKLNVLKNLKKVDVSSSNYKDEVIQVFFELTQIEELDLSYNNSFSGDQLVLSNFNSNLKKLNFNKCSNLIDVSLEAISNLKSLSELNLSECKKITDNGIKHLAKLPLTSLNLEKCELLTDEALEYIGKIDSLHYLNLEYCINISDEGIKYLSNLNHLEELNLRWCEGVSYKGLKHLINLPNLKIIKTRNHLKRFPWEELKNLSQVNKNVKFL